MNVSQQNTDQLNAVINVTVTAADYQEKVEKSLRTYRQKANVPGFRKGLVPMGMVKKMVGKSILVEEINRLVSEQLFSYIRDNKLNVLGEPLPSESQQPVDFDNQTDFTFAFDIALAPEIKVSLTKKNKVDYYTINVTDEMIQKQIDAYADRFGANVPTDVAGEKDMLKGTLKEMTAKGTVKRGGMSVEDAVISPAYLKDEAEKAKFADAKAGDKIVFNPSVACGGNEAELAAMLHVQKEATKELTGDFEFRVSEVNTYKPAAVDQELFDKVYGKDAVKDEAAFREKIAQGLADQFVAESDYKFSIDARAAIEKAVGDVALPEAFLKRWLLASNSDKTAESVDAEFPAMVPELKWHLIKEQLVKDNAVKVDEADLLAVAKKATQAQFAQYGMTSVPDDLLENYAKEMLKNKDSVRSLAERATEDKIIGLIKENVTLNEKPIDAEAFYKLFETK